MSEEEVLAAEEIVEEPVSGEEEEVEEASAGRLLISEFKVFLDKTELWKRFVDGEVSLKTLVQRMRRKREKSRAS